MTTTSIRVSLQSNETIIPVGRLASLNHQIYFEYDIDFLKTHWLISPFHLPLAPGLKSNAPCVE